MCIQESSVHIYSALLLLLAVGVTRTDQQSRRAGIQRKYIASAEQESRHLKHTCSDITGRTSFLGSGSASDCRLCWCKVESSGSQCSASLVGSHGSITSSRHPGSHPSGQSIYLQNQLTLFSKQAECLARQILLWQLGSKKSFTTSIRALHKRTMLLKHLHAQMPCVLCFCDAASCVNMSFEGSASERECSAGDCSRRQVC